MKAKAQATLTSLKHAQKKVIAVSVGLIGGCCSKSRPSICSKKALSSLQVETMILRV